MFYGNLHILISNTNFCQRFIHVYVTGLFNVSTVVVQICFSQYIFYKFHHISNLYIMLNDGTVYIFARFRTLHKKITASFVSNLLAHIQVTVVGFATT